LLRQSSCFFLAADRETIGILEDEDDDEHEDDS
jgi:hypothetical protein